MQQNLTKKNNNSYTNKLKSNKIIIIYRKSKPEEIQIQNYHYKNIGSFFVKSISRKFREIDFTEKITITPKLFWQILIGMTNGLENVQLSALNQMGFGGWIIAVKFIITFVNILEMVIPILRLNQLLLLHQKPNAKVQNGLK